MMFPVIVIGDNIKEQLAPYWYYRNLQWHDVTDLYLEKWHELGDKRGKLDTFEKWLEFYNFWKAERLPENPLANMKYAIRENGCLKAWRYENPVGYWSHYSLGENYTDFFQLKNGQFSLRAKLADLDIRREIKETRQAFAKRWEKVNEAAKKEAPKPWNYSAALRMGLKEYVEKRTAEYVAPGAIVWEGCYPPSSWLWLDKLPPKEKLQTYLDILARLTPDETLTVVECHD